jgi:hypothetical protein
MVSTWLEEGIRARQLGEGSSRGRTTSRSRSRWRGQGGGWRRSYPVVELVGEGVGDGEALVGEEVGDGESAHVGKSKEE